MAVNRVRASEEQSTPHRARTASGQAASSNVGADTADRLDIPLSLVYFASKVCFHLRTEYHHYRNGHNK